jgi:integrase
MARTIEVLTAKEIEQLSKKPGMHRADEGLYLQVKNGACSWLHRYRFRGVPRLSGLGAYPGITLAIARKKRDAEHAQVLAGVDPVAERRRKRTVAPVEKPKATFRDVAKAFIANHESQWTNPKHHWQWTTSLEQFVYPHIGDTAVDAITVEDVRQVLQPIWYTKAVTASRVRARIENVLSFAKPLGLRTGENVARWKDNLEFVFPRREKKRKKIHHAALPHEELPGFLVKLRAQGGIAARALEFIILTAVRTGDVNGQDHEGRPPMMWKHVDLAGKLWTIPATKNDGEHRVPLSDPAIAVLNGMKALGLDTDLVFPSLDRKGQPMSSNAMLVLLGRMDCRERTTVHGFRSSFRDWAGECTSFPRELAEKALAHTIGDETERAYQRGDLLNKRRKLMEAWAGYCMRPAATADVVPLRSKAV